jgi:RES domain-containing protein
MVHGSTVAAGTVPAWRASPATPETRAIGDDWVRTGSSLALKVPSVITPNEFNYLLNPAHPDFAILTPAPPIPYPFDPRLLR